MNTNSTDWRLPKSQPLCGTEDFITELFCRVDAAMAGVGKHPQANLWPGEVVTLAILYAIKGCGERAFYRWARRDLRPLFPGLPERTRLFRLFATHRDWTEPLPGRADVLWRRRQLWRGDDQHAAAGPQLQGRSAGAASAPAAGSPGSSWAWSSTAAAKCAPGTRTRRWPTTPTRSAI